MEHIFSLNIDWTGGRNGIGNLAARDLNTEVSIPFEMNGPNVGTNPDEMLLGASATCYIITLAMLLEKHKLNVQSLSVASEATVDVTNGVYTFKEILHKPHIVTGPLEERLVQKVEKLAIRAEETCMISKALKGNVDIHVQLLHEMR
jgi:peroxiredoxin-like protein